MGKLIITISLAFLLGCPAEKTPEKEAPNSLTNLKIDIIEEQEVHAFQQDPNKSYLSIDRPWVLAKPIQEFNENKLYVPLNE